MIELVNQLLQECLYEDFNDGDLSFLQSMSHIVLKPRYYLREQIYRTKMGLNKSFALTQDFLSRFHGPYGEYFDTLVRHAKIHEHELDEDGISYMEITEDGKFIEFYPNQTIEDAYTLSHECMHSWNCDEENITDTWCLMTECFSIVMESLQQDYFRASKTFYPEYQKNKRDTYYALRNKALMMKFEMELIEFYRMFGYIDEDLLAHMFKGMSPLEQELAYDDLEWMMKNHDLHIYALSRYVVGGVLASHMHQRILSKKRNIQEFIELNDYCNEILMEDVLRYLDLEVLDDETLQLSGKSLEQLSYHYQKELKSL